MSGYSSATSRADAQEEPVGALHDVGLVHRGDLAAAVRARVLEGEAHDALAALARDDLDALGGVVADHVLDAGVEVLGVLAHDDEVDVVEAAAHALHRLGRAQAGVQVELLAQRHVDAAEARADRRRDRPLDRHLVAADRLEHVLGQRRAVLLHHVEAGVVHLPDDGHAGGGDHGLERGGQLGAGAVAGDQGHV